MTDTANDFDAAKAVVDQLKGLEKDRQERVLRWVAESLKLDLGPRGVVHGPGGGPVAVQPDVAPHPSPPPGQHRAVDIKSFVDTKKPKSDVQFAAVVAYYYRFEASPEHRREAIDSKALQDAARLAGRRRPPKPLVTLNNAKTLGYLDAPERGQFQINNVGENLVAMTLPGSEEKKAHRKAKRKSKPRGGRSKER